MKNAVDENERQLFQKLGKGGHTNLTEWFERFTEEFYKEQVSVDNIKERFYNELVEQLLYSLPTLLFIFLIDKGSWHIVEPPTIDANATKKHELGSKKKEWEKFMQ